ncbi:hypothetical protein AV530_007382 [Patagioenas fasciata monilis]|uniref:Uncharacterized protein n=1 Tax=Patagioenas fasciata monilis TaxID=372326 RepID=A0A1V4JXJ8_PATFA|nr:hypothetical protein AV530_007382 [Patagioenas fasciata monilis]
MSVRNISIPIWWVCVWGQTVASSLLCSYSQWPWDNIIILEDQWDHEVNAVDGEKIAFTRKKEDAEVRLVFVHNFWPLIPVLSLGKSFGSHIPPGRSEGTKGGKQI